MLSAAPKPQPNQPPPQVSPFETGEAKPKSEVDQLIRTLGEQVTGNYTELKRNSDFFYDEPLHPVLQDKTIDNLQARDLAHIKANYPTLKERLRHMSQATQERERKQKQQEAQAKMQQKSAGTPALEATTKGSLKDRMFSAMGIKRGKKTASLADKSQTREIARTPSQ